MLLREHPPLKQRMYLWWSLCTLYLHASQARATAGDWNLCCLCLCDVFWALIVCWIYKLCTLDTSKGDGSSMKGSHLVIMYTFAYTYCAFDASKSLKPTVERDIHRVEIITNDVQIMSNYVEITLSCFAQRLTSVKNTHLVNILTAHARRTTSGHRRRSPKQKIRLNETQHWSSSRGRLLFFDKLNLTANLTTSKNCTMLSTKPPSLKR